jgi:hypothetical protein
MPIRNCGKLIFARLVLLFFLFGSPIGPLAGQTQNDVNTITVHINPGHPINRFVPAHAFGGAIDGHEKGEVNAMLSPANAKEMLTAGLGPVSYRLRTELGIEAWHWNPVGRWSDAAKHQGYWISRGDTTGGSISLSYGYKLPRRGSTIDQANEDGYSRLDDGNAVTFWKSNPYLDQHFTREENSTLPQWVVIDLGKETPVNAIRLLWAKPYARVYEVQHSRFPGGDLSQALPHDWIAFPQGKIVNGRGGDETIRLAIEPYTTRFIRVLMTESSGTAQVRSADIRDRLGYAMREIYVGTIDTKRAFHDVLKRATVADDQSTIYTSSTDPWHRSEDFDRRVEQPGFDRLFHSPLSNRLPMLIPIAVLYDTPENAAAEVRYLKARGYRLEGLELGEEPDGQFVDPEEYAALYLQFATAIHAVDPNLKLGGPSFQDVESDEDDPAVNGKPRWLQRFLGYLERHGRLSDYAFFSFEWYPFDDPCQPTGPQLARATDMLKHALAEMQRGGLTHQIPWMITEYGYSAFAGRPEMDIESAILNADMVGNFLALGGDQTFLYGYEPNEAIQEVPCSMGNMMLFQVNSEGAISARMPTFYGARLTTQEWAEPGDQINEMYSAEVTGPGADLITAYAVRRPDGKWALMILNKDPDVARRIEVDFRYEDRGTDVTWSGPVDLYQYSRAQYVLNTDPKDPRPIKDDPPDHRVLADPEKAVNLPPYSMTIVRGGVY